MPMSETLIDRRLKLGLFVLIEVLFLMCCLLVRTGYRSGFDHFGPLLMSSMWFGVFLYVLIYLSAVIHDLLLMKVMGGLEKPNRRDVSKWRTYGFVLLTGVFMLVTFSSVNSTYALVFLYIPLLALVSFFTNLLLLKITGKRR